jgi:hypothetical protein
MKSALASTESLSRPEARRRFGSETASELGARVASSIPNSCLGASPHQQGRDTKMAMLSFGGIDVSKDRLDVMLLPEEKCASVSNDAAGWTKLVEQLRSRLGQSASRRAEDMSAASCAPCSRRHACAPSQSAQASPVRQSERSSRQERSARCSHDSVVRRDHADTSGAAVGTGGQTARRDARRSPSA